MRRPDLGDLRRARLSAWALVVANLVPLLGVVVLDWDLGVVMLLFWAENGVIGLWSMVRMTIRAGIGAVVLIPFFIVHFGGFMAGHLLFLGLIVLQVDVFQDGLAPVLADHGRLFAVALVSLFASHGVSFWQHFLKGGERAGDTATGEMVAPYLRVFILHVAIIGGSFPVMALGEPMWALVLLVALKIGVDLLSHAASHAQRKAAEKTGGTDG